MVFVLLEFVDLGLFSFILLLFKSCGNLKEMRAWTRVCTQMHIYMLHRLLHRLNIHILKTIPTGRKRWENNKGKSFLLVPGIKENTYYDLVNAVHWLRKGYKLFILSSFLEDSNFTSHEGLKVVVPLTLAVKHSHLESQLAMETEILWSYVFSYCLCATEHPPRAISLTT